MCRSPRCSVFRTKLMPALPQETGTAHAATVFHKSGVSYKKTRAYLAHRSAGSVPVTAVSFCIVRAVTKLTGEGAVK